MEQRTCYVSLMRQSHRSTLITAQASMQWIMPRLVCTAMSVTTLNMDVNESACSHLESCHEVETDSVFLIAQR